VGTAAEPGSALVTLSGCVVSPGVYEIELGLELGALISAAGGLTGEPRAALVGGYGGAWVAGEHLGALELCEARLQPFGASLGAGVVVLLDSKSCPVAETLRVADWLARQSTGQCGPCAHGLPAIAAELARIAGGVCGTPPTHELERLAVMVHRRGACAHPDGACTFVLSAIDAFAPELADHALHGPCEACSAPARLPLPENRA
jgi:NADH:ubiquinone oxidoreductase subunit F (NADH-binding)